MTQFGKKPPGGRPRTVKPNIELVQAMDETCMALLKSTKTIEGEIELSLEEKLNIFDKAAKWIGIRDKTNDQSGDENDGSGISGYKSAIQSAASNPGGSPRKVAGRSPAERLKSATAAEPDSDIPIGTGLAGLKSSLPHADDGGDEGDSLRPLGSVVTGAFNRRGVRIGISDDERPGRDEAGGERDL